MISIKKIHHVAYRCHDAKETADWYKEMLNMELTVSISEDKVPSTQAPDPYMHIFLDAGMGNVLAFFELTNAQNMGKDPNTPAWVQHIAFQLQDYSALESAKENLESKGIDVLGITNHGIFKSIYFFDINGHRLELCSVNGSVEQMKKLKDIAPDMLEEWSKTKMPPESAKWLHSEDFDKDSQ
ncbi:MAG: glyoxylase I family protein [Thermoproteota archaeon]|jgi:glyoxylase I family protein